MPSIEYFAGHFDGEGCLSMERHGNGWRLLASVKACHLPVLDFYKATFGGTVRQRAAGATHKMLWEWYTHNQSQLLNFLEAIGPFALEKKPQIHVALEWLRARKAFPKHRVPHSFIVYGNQCASFLMQLKRVSIEEHLP
jgi:hypothetical protein